MNVRHGSTDTSNKWLATAMRDVRSRTHRNLRRRRAHMLSIDRHHTQEQDTFGRAANAG
jgi:hypothetical protein